MPIHCKQMYSCTEMIKYLHGNRHIVACPYSNISEDFSSLERGRNPADGHIDWYRPQERLCLSHPQTVKWRQRNGLNWPLTTLSRGCYPCGIKAILAAKGKKDTWVKTNENSLDDGMDTKEKYSDESLLVLDRVAK